MDSDVGHAIDCVYYDSELKDLKASFKEAYSILKRIDKRAERRQTVQVSKSLFDYVEKQGMLRAVPSEFFDFKYNDTRICIYRFKKSYAILVIGFDWSTTEYELWRSDYFGVGHLYGYFKTPKDAMPAYLKCVHYFLHEVMFLDFFELI